MSIAYLGLGSNLGDRENYIQQALTLLNKNSIRLLKISSLRETNPVNCPKRSGNFLNAAAKVSTDLSPEELLTQINSIESQLGRKRSEKNAPRTIDIDILLYDDILINTPKLAIPHPKMRERDFVMQPLKEIGYE